MDANKRELVFGHAKTIDRVTDDERGQILNYLRITGMPVGVILNFKHAKLEWERLILTREPRTDASEHESEAPDFHAEPKLSR